MEELDIIITETEGGKRLDKCLTDRLGREYSRTYVKFLIDNGFVLVKSKKVKACYLVHEGDEIFVKIVDTLQNENLEAENIPLNIIYEDECLIVVNKPYGMVVHPGAGIRKGTLVNALLFHCGKLPNEENELRPGIVHRLDKDTSGVMVAAKTSKALRSLAEQFQKRAVKKNYIALVKGRLELDNGIIEAPLARHKTDRKKMQVEHLEGKEARTIYHVLRRYEKFTVIRVELLTGRTHQIRVHMNYLGHPVLGDTKYGSDKSMKRQALHSEKLGFFHPDTGKYMEFSASIPADIKEVIDNAAKNG
ncbi:MAG: RluA family pseudouridine synthase [Candidatus Omnitrophota bacterium]|nr:RluA family pseudouridine synthase [Candidatus Omnitrophota bacterium]MBU1894308.1 RluA family pseudouridine synthase [Candidatus Omnitrophota bacterium]